MTRDKMNACSGDSNDDMVLEEDITLEAVLRISEGEPKENAKNEMCEAGAADRTHFGTSLFCQLLSSMIMQQI